LASGAELWKVRHAGGVDIAGSSGNDDDDDLGAPTAASLEARLLAAGRDMLIAAG